MPVTITRYQDDARPVAAPGLARMRQDRLRRLGCAARSAQEVTMPMRWTLETGQSCAPT